MYGYACDLEHVYIEMCYEFGEEPVQAFLDYVIRGSNCTIATALQDLSRTFKQCLVNSEDISESEFSSLNDDIIHVGNYRLNMSTWENEHIQCVAPDDCIERSQASGLSCEDRVRFLSKALQYDCNNPEALYLRAIYCAELGFCRDSISDLKRYLELVEGEDDKLGAAFLIIEWHSRLDLCDGGVEFANEWISRFPRDPDLLFGRARLLCKAGQFSKAIDDLVLCEELGHGSLNESLAQISEELGVSIDLIKE